MKELLIQATQFVPAPFLYGILGFVAVLICWSILAEPIRNELYVNMGISADMDKHKAHGSVWVKTVDGGIVKRYFLVDKPEKLEKPRWFIVRDMFHQISQMNLHPDTIEIKLAGKTLIYRLGKRRPVVVHT